MGQSDPMSHPRYAPMRPRAARFAPTAKWASALFALAILWFGFQALFTAIYTVWAESPRITANSEAIDAFILGATPAAVGWSLAAFGLYTILLAIALRNLHHLRLTDLFGPRDAAWRQFKRVLLYLAPLFALLTIPSILDPTSFQNLSFGKWLILLPLMLPLLFIQISAEELVFRGYLQSTLAALAPSPIIWLGLPAILFGLIHYDPTAPTYSAWAYVAWAAALGLAAGDLTARSGTLGPALALHFINNIFAMLVLATDDWLFGAALFIWPTNGLPWEPWLPYEALVLLILWLACRIAIKR